MIEQAGRFSLRRGQPKPKNGNENLMIVDFESLSDLRSKRKLSLESLNVSMDSMGKLDINL